MSDVKLDIQVLKNILQLNSALPDDYKKCWITVDEMRERLVHCGVDKALTTDILMTALTRANRSGVILEKRPQKERRSTFVLQLMHIYLVLLSINVRNERAKVVHQSLLNGTS